MALNETLYRQLISGGVGHYAALQLADPDTDNVTVAPVANPPALTSTTVDSPNAVNPAAGAYTVADQTAVATLANETKADVNALRADVAALRTTVANLLAALRTGGVLQP